MDAGDAKAALARIEANVGHLAEESQTTRTTVEALRSDFQELRVSDATRHERTASAVMAVDQRLERHEVSDDRRFRGIGHKLDAMAPASITNSKVRQVVTKGGLAAGGGGVVLVLLELLKLMGGE
jgi:hypothetical protein